jgi:hypothetical protein
MLLLEAFYDNGQKAYMKPWTCHKKKMYEVMNCNLYELKSRELQSLYQSSPVVTIFCSPEFCKLYLAGRPLVKVQCLM